MEESPIERVRSAEPQQSTHRLAERIIARANTLVARTVEEMYRNPFWIERYGDRGRRFSIEDGRYHLEYLADALRWRSGAIMSQYSAWLQSVLVARGMCSLHLDEHFARLGAAIEQEFGTSADDAIALLTHARRGLLHTQPHARALHVATPRLIDRIVHELGAIHTGWSQARVAPDRAAAPDDPEYVISYLTDACALSNPRILADYIAWLTEYSTRHRVPASRLADMLQSLARALAESPELAPAADILARARESSK